MIRLIVIRDQVNRSAMTRVLHCLDAAAWPLIALGAAYTLNGASVPMLVGILLISWMIVRIWRASRNGGYSPTTWVVCRALGFVVLLCLALLLAHSVSIY